jgi:mono/diheme cytochrome c family protein
MFRSPALAALTASLVLGAAHPWAPLPGCAAAEGSTAQSARPNADNRVWRAADIGQVVASKDLPYEPQEQSFESRLALYLSRQADETAHVAADESSDYLADDATDETAVTKADKSSKPDAAASSSGRRTAQDEAQIGRGRSEFESSCTQCHDAARATSKRKSYSSWLATVARMAAKEGAEIPTSEHAAIAAYLASLNPANSAVAKGDSTAADDAASVAEPPFTLNGTISPVYRGTESDLENKGFFPDTWIEANWRTSTSPVSGRVVACASCHGVNNDGLGVELVEAAATVDLLHLLTRCPREKRCDTWQAELTAGRFVVPFGAYSGRVHPGSLRTVSLPLMFNMGRRVGDISLLQPVLPMPYSDEGVDVQVRRKIGRDWNATFDAYGVNGLQSGGPGEFTASRSYVDNNSNTAVGGRGTLGTQNFRVGGSVASGELQDQGNPLQNYNLTGGDVSYRWEEWLRLNYEYAIRVEDSFSGPSRSIAYGNYGEAELLLRKDPAISLLFRYDTLDHRGFLGTQDTRRYTYGVNWVLPGGSLLILDQEHWIFDNNRRANILAMRWTVAF